MKGFRIILAAACLILSISCFAQGQITTRREKLKDFSSKTTKVVIPDDDILAEALMEGVTSTWTITTYEFCSQAEFDKDKTNGNFYFLLIVNSKQRKEITPSIKMITLVKGGEGADKSINDMLEVVSFPLCSATESTGREMIIIPAILTIMQRHASSLTDSELKAYMNVKVSPKDMKTLSKKRVYISKDDLAPQVNESRLSKLNPDLVIKEEDYVDSLLTEKAYNACISYVVAPEEPMQGSLCYKMIIEADTYKLLYYKKHKITARNGIGFLPSDLDNINDLMK
ncbi:MAG: hypothetical protein PUK70_00695 [Bacteroidales bacterium]|nr:hypothetical protein [Bacteroidales bacterium]MDY6002342.1 hypothetical protein [Candidatus Cryptobacteroides sp.]